MDNIQIKSKMRIGYLVQCAATNIFILFVIIVLFLSSFIDGKIDYLSMGFWLSIFFGAIYLFNIFFLTSLTFKKVCLTKNEIIFTNGFSGKKRHVNYSEIFNTKIRRVTPFSHREAPISCGYEQLIILLSKDRMFTINENQYSNYNEMKFSLYKLLKDK